MAGLPQQPAPVGTLTLFLAYISRFYMRLDSMSRMLSATQRAAASAQRIFGVMDREATVAEPVHPVHPGRLQGASNSATLPSATAPVPWWKGSTW